MVLWDDDALRELVAIYNSVRAGLLSTGTHPFDGIISDCQPQNGGKCLSEAMESASGGRLTFGG